MAENTEQIESQLAAYVDGELFGDEKLEIEKHLASNPAHRALIQDLMAHKQMVQKLPSEPAPGDLTEGLQFQLEREVLLSSDPLEEARRSSMRLNRLPQLLSLAAVAVLTVGLGIVVYSVLPPRHPIAKIEPSAVPGVMEGDMLREEGAVAGGGVEEAKRSVYRDSTQDERREPALGEQLGAVRIRTAPAPAVTRGGETPAPNEPPADRSWAGRALAEKGIAESATTGMFDLATSAGPKFGADDANATVLLTVNATDVGAAKEQILAYFQANQIAWSYQSAKAESSLARLARSDPETELKKTVEGVAAEAEVLYQREKQAAAPAGASNESRHRLVPAEKEPGIAEQAAKLREQALAAKTADGTPRPDAGATSNLAVAAAGADAPAREVFAQIADKKNATKNAELLKQTFENAAGAPVVVASLNAGQVEQLTRVLSVPERNQWAMSRQLTLAADDLQQVQRQMRRGEMDADVTARFETSRQLANAPATQPGDGYVTVKDMGLRLEPATRPSNTVDDKVAFGALTNGGLTLQQGQGLGDAQKLELFTCVIVLKTPSPATQPATTQPATRPVNTPVNTGVAQPASPPAAADDKR